VLFWVPKQRSVMAGLVQAIHAFLYQAKTWMPATGAGMTKAGA